jgi:hypothetical protein
MEPVNAMSDDKKQERSAPSYFLGVNSSNGETLIDFVDKTKLHLTTEELDRLIAELGNIRSRTPRAASEDTVEGRQVQATFDPRWFLRRNFQTSVVEFFVRHAGFGWLACVLPAQEVAKIVTLLTTEAPAPDVPPRPTPRTLN